MSISALQPDHMMLLMQGRDRIKPAETRACPGYAGRPESHQLESNRSRVIFYYDYYCYL